MLASASLILLAAAVLVWRNLGETTADNQKPADASRLPGTAQAPAASGAESNGEQPLRPRRPRPALVKLPEDTNEIRELSPGEARELLRRHQEGGELSLNGLATPDADPAFLNVRAEIPAGATNVKLFGRLRANGN